MGYPDFSEFSFGYAIVRQIEQTMLGRWAVPSFPTQPQEATGGYDVDFLSHGVPLFIQFKRSEVMQRRSSKEFRDPTAKWTLPLYRMHLHDRNGFRQHMLLRALENDGNVAVYCTSTVPSKAELDDLYATNNTFRAAVLFWPSEISLPTLHQPHHVAFDRPLSMARVYSETGAEFEPRTPRFEDLFQRLRHFADASAQTQIERLKSFVEQVIRVGADNIADQERNSVKVELTVDELGKELGGTQQISIFDEPFLAIGRRDTIERISQIESVVRQAALIAYFEIDAFLVSVSKEALRK